MARPAAKGCAISPWLWGIDWKDVVHTHALWCNETYPGRKDPPSSGYRAGICAVERIEVVNDHDIVMHCKGPCLDMPFYYSSASDAVIFSKAQWDKEGEM